jgi:hypothetical protein
MPRIAAPIAVFLRLTLALAVGLGLTPALHAKAGFVLELCSPEGAVAVVLDGTLPAADCPDCPDCLLFGPALLPQARLPVREPGFGAVVRPTPDSQRITQKQTVLTPPARGPPLPASA